MTVMIIPHEPRSTSPRLLHEPRSTSSRLLHGRIPPSRAPLGRTVRGRSLKDDIVFGSVKEVTKPASNVVATQKSINMIDSIPILAQYKSLITLIWGNIWHGNFSFDVEDALQVNRDFIDVWTNRKLELLDQVANSTPVVGLIKGGIHYIRHEQEAGDRAMKGSFRAVVVIFAGAVGALTGPYGAVAAGVAAGATFDLVLSGIEGRPEGLWAAIESMVERGDVGDVFDVACIITFDGFAGKAGGQIGAKGFAGTQTETASLGRMSVEVSKSGRGIQLVEPLTKGMFSSDTSISIKPEVVKSNYVARAQSASVSTIIESELRQMQGPGPSGTAAKTIQSQARLPAKDWSPLKLHVQKLSASEIGSIDWSQYRPSEMSNLRTYAKIAETFSLPDGFLRVILGSAGKVLGSFVDLPIKSILDCRMLFTYASGIQNCEYELLVETGDGHKEWHSALAVSEATRNLLCRTSSLSKKIRSVIHRRRSWVTVQWQDGTVETLQESKVWVEYNIRTVKRGDSRQTQGGRDVGLTRGNKKSIWGGPLNPSKPPETIKRDDKGDDEEEEGKRPDLKPVDTTKRRWDQLQGLVPYLERLGQAIRDLDADQATIQATQGRGYPTTAEFLDSVNRTLNMQAHARWDNMDNSWDALVANGRNFIRAFQLQRVLDIMMQQYGDNLNGLWMTAFGVVVERFDQLLELVTEGVIGGPPGLPGLSSDPDEDEPTTDMRSD